MIISDRARAKHYFGFISYYRLSGYWFPFQNPFTIYSIRYE